METPYPVASGRRVLVAGATGLVGREILHGLLTDASVAQVHVLARRMPDIQSEKMTVHIVDFAALAPLPPLDEAYLALGTTIKTAGSQAAFRAVDFDANLAVARAAMAAGARRLGLVSAMGADARSRVFYSRVKGELETALAALGPLDALVIARPSMLHGDRARLGQPARPGERWALRLSQLLGPLIPAHYRPVAARDVARALLARVQAVRGYALLLSGDMQPT